MGAVLDTALAADAAGICVIPAAGDGTKAPRPGRASWKEYQARRPTPDEHQRWFGPGGAGGLGVVCGAISGNLEMLEFEGRALDEGVYDTWLRLAHHAGLDELVDRITTGYSETTPSGGVHWLYRVDGAPVPGNVKLAQRPATAAEIAANPHDKVKVLIETRGEGGFCIIAPSNGTTHPSGGTWELNDGGIDQVAVITTDEHAQLHDLARALDTIPDPPATRDTRDHRPAQPADGDLRPGDWYNTAATWPDLLEAHGWTHVYTHGDTDYWRRPGKTTGVSATVNALGTDRLHVHTTSTPFDTTSYDLFGAYALLEHQGDLKTAARAIAAVMPKQHHPAAAGAGRPPADATPGAGDDTPVVHECSDLGNARRLVDAHGPDFHYIPAWGRFIAWDGQRWQPDALGQVDHWAVEVVDRIRHEPAADTDHAKKLFRHWLASQSRRGLDNMVASTRKIVGVNVEHTALDADPWALNTLDGTLDLRTGRLHPHDRRQLLSRLAPVHWDPDTPTPVFDRFLERITGGDQALAGYLQRAIGYSITGVTGEQVLFFAHGHGANGKSTLMNAMRSALGDYWAALAPDTLVNDGSAQHPTNIADLVGKRFVVSQEVEEGRRIDEQLVKQLTGGDRLKARFMRQDFFEFTATHKIWLCANHKPFVRGTDHAIWRRIKLIPFTVTIPDSERDTHLDAKLAAEAPGILAWAVQGCLWWQRDGLAAPDSVEGATAGYRVEQDVLGRFLEDRCFVEPGNEQMRCAAASLRGSYVEWCDEQGERPMSARALAPHLRERGLVSVKDRRSHTWWLGLAVNDAARLQPNEGDLDA